MLKPESKRRREIRMQALLPLLILVPCVLMMVMMMRGHGHGHQEKPPAAASTTDLRKRREELDRLIGERERDEGRTT
jgi:hypothetical protein